MRTLRLLAAGFLVAAALLPAPTALAHVNPEPPDDPVGPVNPNPPQGLKKYDWNLETNTGKCWNTSCSFGWCCWVY